MSRVAPSLVGDREFLKWFAKVQRHFLPPDGAGDLMRTAIETVIAPVLPMVHVPTLVMAREWENHQQDREISAEIDGARFALLPGTERATFAGDQDSLVGAIQDFLGVTPAAGASGTLLRAVLFTDIVGSTTNLATMGDLKWREVLVSHDERTTRAVEEHGGHVVKSTGDGVLATFEGPAQAVRAALAAADAVKNLGIEIRSGVHVGEIEMKGDDVMGVTVHVAARVAALAGASQTLVSQTVKDLVAGSGLVFQDQGTHELKGVPDSWHLYEVTR
jgi:class 3 adenylate cyclase